MERGLTSHAMHEAGRLKASYGHEAHLYRQLHRTQAR